MWLLMGWELLLVLSSQLITGSRVEFDVAYHLVGVLVAFFAQRWAPFRFPLTSDTMPQAHSDGT